MTVKLNKKQFDYLKHSLFDKQESLKLNLRVKEEIRYILIEVDEEAADEIRDWASEKLQRIGFDINYKLTNEGKMLESLIDKFYIE